MKRNAADGLFTKPLRFDSFKGSKVKILFIGDIVGNAGRKALLTLLGRIVEGEGIDFTIANGENAAGGIGITPTIAREFLETGVDVITSGNHIWAKKEIIQFLDEEKRILRPANYPDGTPGKGSRIFTTRTGQKIGVANLEGRVFMRSLDCPFAAAEKELMQLKRETVCTVIDFHAEATSEKMALGWFLDGRASAVLGTHTHVQTSDEQILPSGTAYITDVGMTGPTASVIGIKQMVAIERFLTQIPRKLDVASREIELQGVILEINPNNGRGESIRRLKVPLV
jgi:metallophosphoesterase (TIGR00282 family)